MAISFKKEVILEAIQAVLAENKAYDVEATDGTKVTKSFANDAEANDFKVKNTNIKSVKALEEDSVEEDHHENPNDDSDMAKSQLYAIAKYAIELLQMIKDGDPLDAWVQAKITKAADYVDAVQHYLEGEEYLDANQEEPEEELAEGDYEPRTKEDLVFQYLRDAWQLGALKGKDFNPDAELSTMADSLITYLPDYDSAKKADEPKEKSFFEKRLDKMRAQQNLKETDSAELEEARRGQGTIQKELDDVKAKMKELAKQYSAGDKSVVSTLKDLTAKKKALESELEDAVAKIGAGQEYKGEVDETLAEGVSCCGRCGRVHESAQECKKPYISKDSPNHCSNKK